MFGGLRRDIDIALMILNGTGWGSIYRGRRFEDANEDISRHI